MELGGVGKEWVEGAWPPSCMRPNATAMLETGWAMAAMLGGFGWQDLGCESERRRVLDGFV